MIVNSIQGSVSLSLLSVLNDFRSEAGAEIECTVALYAKSCTKERSCCYSSKYLCGGSICVMLTLG